MLQPDQVQVEAFVHRGNPIREAYFILPKYQNKIMAITASMVKELREMTGAGMMDCRRL